MYQVTTIVACFCKYIFAIYLHIHIMLLSITCMIFCEDYRGTSSDIFLHDFTSRLKQLGVFSRCDI